MTVKEFADLNYNRFESYCNETPERLDVKKYTVIRIDGKNFHTYTRSFLKPYDPVLHYLLDLSYHLVFKSVLNNQFECWYSQSDEVTVVIHPTSLSYKKKSKLISILPSAISSTFVCLLSFFNDINPNIVYIPIKEILYDLIGQQNIFNFKWFNPKLLKKHYTSVAFDARLFQTDTIQVVNDLLEWRRIDAINNSKNSYAQVLLGKKKIVGMRNDKKLRLMQEEHKFNWYALPTFIKRGFLMTDKKEEKEYGFIPSDRTTERYKNAIKQGVKLWESFRKNIIKIERK